MNQVSEHNTSPVAETAPSDPLAEVRDMVRGCMQCGTCTASCPSAFAMDMAPRVLWRSVLMGRIQEVLDSMTFWLCSNCYTCTLRCPRGLPLTEAINALRRIAHRVGGESHEKQSLFYQVFMGNVRENGRVSETGLMSKYLLSMRNPLLPLNFLPLGVKLFRKGKLSLFESGHMEKERLAPLYDYARQRAEKQEGA